MSLILYINGQQVDLEPSYQINQTKQVNDLNSIDTREANLTNQFKVPKTANNMRVMNFLTTPGNRSNIPYQKNECSMYSHTGECFIYKGWAVITDDGDDFKVVVYDGVIDLYKAIDNRNLGELGLDEINHGKSIETIKASWDSDLPYCYIVADYNGHTFLESENALNVDYMVPSVSVAYLWNKVFEKFQFEYSGAVFDSFNFKNLWMTYPKGIVLSDADNVTIFKSDDYLWLSVYANGTNAANSRYFAQANTVITNTLVQFAENRHMKVGQAGTYKIKVKGTIYPKRLTDSSGYQPSRIYFGKNAEGQGTNSIEALASNTIANDVPGGTEFEVEKQIELQANDSICLMFKGSNTQAYNFYIGHGSEIEVELVRVDPLNYDFSIALSDFGIREFLTEIVHRFGLTVFPDKYGRSYRFLTLQEQLQEPDTVDWTNKFSKKISENYTYGSYAQRNWMRYNYNDKEATHNDGFIDINNINLPANKDVIKSKIYSPEFQVTKLLGRNTNVYKLWDKEIVEEPGEGDPVLYKTLDKRYYFMRRDVVNTVEAINLFSQQLSESGTANTYYIESFYKLGFADIKQDYYEPLQKIFDKSTVVTAELYLNESDIANFDFKKLYYIQQLGNYFLVNKINNYIPGITTKCELVRVMYYTEPSREITIVQHQVTGSDVAIWFTTNYPPGAMKLQVILEGVDWITLPDTVTSPAVYHIEFNVGLEYIRVYDATNEVYSETITIGV